MSQGPVFPFGNLAAGGTSSVPTATKVYFSYQGFGSSTYNNDYDYSADPYGVTQYPSLGTGWAQVNKTWLVERLNYDANSSVSSIVAYFNPPTGFPAVPGPGSYNLAVSDLSGSDFGTFSATPHYRVSTYYNPYFSFGVEWYQNCTLTMTLPSPPDYGFYRGSYQEDWTYTDTGGHVRAFLRVYRDWRAFSDPDTTSFGHIGIADGSPGAFIVRTGAVTPTSEALSSNSPGTVLTQKDTEFTLTAPYTGAAQGFDVLLTVAGQTDDPQNGPGVFVTDSLDAITTLKLKASTDADFFQYDFNLIKSYFWDPATLAQRKSQGVYAVRFAGLTPGTSTFYLFPEAHLDPIGRYLSPLKSWSKYFAAPNYPYTQFGNGVLNPETLSGNFPFINNPQGPLTLIPMNYGLNPDFLITVTITITPPPTKMARARCNLSAPYSHYCRAENAPASSSGAGGGILFWRAFGPVPKLTTPEGGGSPTLWAVNAAPITTAATDTSPSLAADSRGFLYCAFQRVSSPAASGDGVYFKASYDGGATWSAEGTDTIMAIPGGTSPVIAQGGGSLHIGALTGSDSAGYKLSTCYKAAGDSVFSTPVIAVDGTGAALSVDKTGVDICKANEGPGRWVLTVLIAGESATSEWWSADNGQSFSRIPTS